MAASARGRFPLRHYPLTLAVGGFQLLPQAYPNTLLSYWVWNGLLKRYPVSTVAPLSLLVPVFGLLGSLAIFGETLSAQKIAALLLIVTGLAVGLYGPRLAHRIGLRA